MKSITFKELCIPFHTHALITYEQDPEQIVYREEDILRLLQTVRVLTLRECAQKARVAEYIPTNALDMHDPSDLTVNEQGDIYQSLSGTRSGDNYVTVDKASILDLAKDTIDI